MNPLLIAGGLSTAAGLAGSLLSKPQRVSVPDIGAELARIRAYYDQAAAVARQGITQRAGEARGQTAANLAARGVYSSPVSENVFGKLESDKQRNLAESDSQIGLGSAQAQAQALGALFGAQQQAAQYNVAQQAQRQAAIYGGLGSLGSSLLGFGLSGMGGQQPMPGSGPVGVPGSPFATNTQNLVNPYQPQRFNFAGWR